jgi:hypothetical protein
VEIGSKIKVLMSLVVFAGMLDVSHWGVIVFVNPPTSISMIWARMKVTGGREEGLCTTSAVKTPTN